MSALIRHTAFQPLITGPLLYILTRGSPDLRQRVLQPLTYLPFQVDTTTVVKTLKWLFALGILGSVNRFLSKLALNNWRFSDGGRAWNMPTEVAAITGGSGGIGSVVVQKLAATGMSVAVMDLQPPASDLMAHPNVSFYKCDVTDSSSVNAAAARIKEDLGAPTILFNNAGIGKTKLILDISDEYLDQIFKINIISHWYTVRAFLPDMIAGRKGHIIATASMASFINAAGLVDYCVTKAAVMSFQEGLAQEVKHRYNAPFIKTTSVHPFWVQTPLIDDWRDKLTSLRSPIMTPEYVGGEIARAILSGKSHQVLLPPSMASASQVRAYPIWFQELVRDGTKNFTLKMSKAG